MNNKGFTLVELIATIVILALVMSIGAISVTSIIKSAKEKNYNILIDNVKSATEIYYQECRYVNNYDNSPIDCSIVDDGYVITLGKLVQYGYLKSDDNSTIINPLNEEDITDCEIKIVYDNGYLKIVSISSSDNCPSEYGEAGDGTFERIPGDLTIDNRLNPTLPITPIKPRS